MTEEIKKKIERAESELRFLEEEATGRVAKEKLAAKTRIETLKEIGEENRD